ncbi:MAG: M20/M25/M40 family metallo-hydrolase [Chloroflexota bacterium]
MTCLSNPIQTNILSSALIQIDHLREKQLALRNTLHSHPELAGQEEQTARVVTEWLQTIGLDVQTDVGGNGVIGTLQGGQPGPTIAYYAPMDAPLVPSADGRGKACVRHVGGHDVNMSIALGLATALTSIREQLPGQVRFLFQPAEMSLDGAYAMLDAGVLDEPEPQAIFALATAPIPVGQIMVGPGVGLPGMERYEITVRTNEDLSKLANTTIERLAAISTLPPFGDLDPQTIFGWLQEDDGPLRSFINVRSDPADCHEDGKACTIRGRIKASDDNAFADARAQINQLLAELTTENCHFGIKYLARRLPNLNSDPKLAKAIIPHLADIAGRDNVLIQRSSFPHGRAGFSLFAERIPGVLLFLGASNFAKGIISLPNTQNFNIDHEALPFGTKLMASVLVNILQTSESVAQYTSPE